MAHNVEPMDIDSSVCDFDDKENAFQHSNVLPRSPCTEKGYEELDVSELNMKLRYSITPVSSPMSKSYTASCLDNRNYDSNENPTIDNENANLTRSLNSTLTKNDSIVKSPKSLPLQVLPTDQFVENTRNVFRSLDTALTVDNNVTITVSEANEIDENISFPSSTSSLTNTPEATTPTSELKNDGGSPILRGLKSVLNMFRPSQSPIPTAEGDKPDLLSEALSPPIVVSPEQTTDKAQPVLVSTPLASYKTKDALSKRNSPNRDSIVFNEDLEKELQWKDETTIIFNDEKIPIHKLLFQQPKLSDKAPAQENKEPNEKLDSTLEFMDISYNDSGVRDKTIAILSDGKTEKVDSDSEFVDCECTFTKNESQLEDFKDLSMDDIEQKLPVNLNVTKDLDTTLSMKSTNISSASTVTTKAAIDNSPLEVVTLPDTAGVEVKQEQMESTISVGHKLIDNIVSPEIKPEEPMLEDLVKTLSKLHDNFAITKPIDSILCNNNNNNLNLDQPPILRNDSSNNSSDHNSNTDTKQISTEINMELNAPVSVPTLENIVINSLSQIPLISDPRVLLFNIPSNELIGEVKPQQDHTSLVTPTEEATPQNEIDASPADIPLPDDDEAEKLVSLPVLDLIDETVVVTDINKVETNISANTIEINSELELKDVKLGSNANETCVTILPSAIDVPDEINETKHISLDATPLTVANQKQVQSNDNLILSEKLKDEQPISINEVPEQSNSVKNDSVVANSITSIPEVVDIPIQLESQEIVNVEKDVPSVNDDRICDNEQKELTCEIKNEVPVEKKSVAEELIASLGDIVKETKVLHNAVPLVPEESQNVLQSKLESVPISLDINDVEKPLEITVCETLHDINVADINKENEANKDLAETKSPENEHIIYQEEAIESLTNKIVSDRMENVEQSNTNGEDNLSTNVDLGVQAEVIVVPVEGPSDKFENELSEAAIVDVISNVSVPNVAPVSETESHSSEIFTVTVAEEKEVNITLQNIEMNTPENNIEISGLNQIITPTSVISGTHIPETNDIIKEEANELLTIPDELKQNSEEKMEIEDVEIVASENNSPFVSVSVQELASEEISVENLEAENPFGNKGKETVSPPISPKIISKGYNFNFDEIEDPFATKTRIRMSPTPGDSSNQTFNQMEDPVENMDFAPIPRKDFNKNRRKSQPARQKPNNSGKKFNSTFNEFSNVALKEQPQFKDEKVKKSLDNVSKTVFNTLDNKSTAVVGGNIEEMENFTSEIIKACDTSILLGPEQPCESCDAFVSEENKSPVESISPVPNEIKNTSSSEQSTYFSADTGSSSNEGVESKNVFNIPEIDDRNFNPFATKSKMRASPPPVAEENPFAPKSKLRDSPELPVSIAQDNKIDDTTNNLHSNTQVEVIVDKTPLDNLETGLEEKDSLNNVSSASGSSKTTDEKDNTVREIHTEDEDTIEGPFLETEDLNEDKLSDFDGENVDMMQFSDLPTNEDNAENGELFIDAEAFEFLLNQNKCNTVSDSGKESLFLKFDPLFAKRVSSDGVVAALSKIKKQQSTPKKLSKPPQKDATFVQTSPISGSSTLNVTHEVDSNSTAEESNDDLNITVSKPMMVVNPAVNPVVTTRKSITPVRSNRRSLTFTSPAIAVIDRLLSLSANNSLVDHDTTIAEVSREQTEADMALTQLRELLADKEISVYNLRTETKELKDRLSTLESQMKSLESISEERLKKINELTEKLNEKTKINKSMATVVEEYERTIASLIAQTEQDKKRNAEERLQLIKERDEQTAHLASMEVSFSDLHSKYEKSKQVILGFKANEDSYKKSIKEFEENLTKMQNNYELLKQHATSKLNHANDELQKMNRAHEAEVLKLNAMIKRKELHITSLEETLLQKTKANDELTAICDELINKVG